MALVKKTYVSYDEYTKLRKDNEYIIEYIEGNICMSPSPSTKHQRISGKLNTKLMLFLEGTDCEVFQAPYDIELTQDDVEGRNIVIPDLSIMKIIFVIELSIVLWGVLFIS